MTREHIDRRRKRANGQPRVVLDRTKMPGTFARKQAERARKAWFESGRVDDWRSMDDELRKREHARLRLWNEYRRQEAGALAEEAVGRFVDLLAGWEGIEVYHSVELRGREMPSGDIDHLVVVRPRSFALAIETKYRLKDDEMAENFSRVRERAAAIQKTCGWWTWPVLCAAAIALREDEPSLGRKFVNDGTVLVTDALTVAGVVTWIVADIDSFRTGSWRFPEHRTS